MFLNLLNKTLIKRSVNHFSNTISSVNLVLAKSRFFCIKSDPKSADHLINFSEDQMSDKDIYDEKYFPPVLKEPGNSLTLFKRYFYENQSIKPPKVDTIIRNSVWNTRCRLFEPKEVTFVAMNQQRKKDSEAIAMAKALMWLRDNEFVDNNFLAIKMSDKQFNEYQESRFAPIELTAIDESLKQEMKKFCEDFNNRIKDKIIEICSNYQSIDIKAIDSETEDITDEEFQTDDDKKDIDIDISGKNQTNGQTINIFTNRKYEEPKEMDLIHREIDLNLFLRKRTRTEETDPEMAAVRQKITALPINSFKEQILETISQNRVVVISGDTGCGKTTQVPQMIFENEIINQRSAFANIVVTEPRRLSAISVSERVAFEFGEKSVGTSIGYNVRFDKVLPKHINGAILFCTAGILLRKLGSNPSLKGVSHLIIDEVHERDVIIDFLLVLLKRALKMNPNIKVILMSASMNANLFVEFFDCPLIEIPGRCYEVKNYYLNDFCDNHSEKKFWPTNPKLDINMTTDLINHLNATKEDGAILVFLPGWAEIQEVMKNLNEKVSNSEDNKLMVVPVHSKLDHSSQRKIFSRPGPGVRKVILSTNIAETSLTIDDVVYVIDSGLAKEMRYNSKLNVSNFGTNWISKANAKQRSGRAGRVREGECYRLYTKEVEDRFMMEFPIPEILRIPLENVVMCSKLHCPNELVAQFLSDVPQPPTVKAIEKAVLSLKEIDVLDQNEGLTLLGQRIIKFTTHPRLSVALIYSSFFCCVKSMLALVSQLSANREPFQVLPDQKFLIRQTKAKFSFDLLSDHISLIGLTNEYQNLFQQKLWEDIRQFQVENNVNRYAMDNILETIKLFASHLEDSNMISKNIWNDIKSEVNHNWHRRHLLVSALIPALIPNFVRLIRGDIKNKKLKLNAISAIDVVTGSKVKFSGESVFNTNFNQNGQLERLCNSLVIYFRCFYSEDAKMLTICDGSLIPPISLLLFSKKFSVKFINSEECVVKFANNNYLSLKMKSDDFRLITDWNSILNNFFQWFITLRPQTQLNTEENNDIYSFLQDFLQLTDQLLEESS